MHAVEYLTAPAKLPQIMVLFGTDQWWKHEVESVVLTQVQEQPDEPAEFMRFAGETCDLKTVRDELATVAMFGGRRLVLVEQADEFVTRFRPALEKLFEHPPAGSLLVLEVQKWLKTTRLAKMQDARRLAIDCAPLSAAQLSRWLIEQAKKRFGKQLTGDAAGLMIELAGTMAGHLDQELSKAVAYVGDRTRINVDDVRTIIGGWQADTAWAMIDAVRDGHAGDALHKLGQLLESGEPPLKLTGGINYVIRKVCAAVETSRRGVSLSAALTDAGMRSFEVPRWEAFLRRIRRPNADRLLRLLLKADQGLKGASPLPERHQLEMLLLQLSGTGS